MTIASTGTATADAADPQRPLEGDGAAEAEPKAEPDERLGLLLAAVEGVGDAARDGGARRSCFSTVSTARRTCSSTGRPNSAASASCAAKKRRLALAVEARRRNGRGRSRRPRPGADRRDGDASASRRRAEVAVARRDRCTSDGCRARRRAHAGARARAPASKLPASTAGMTIWRTPAARARATTASRSASNSAASRWQWVSIHTVDDDASAAASGRRCDRSWRACYRIDEGSARRASLRGQRRPRSRPGCPR